MKISSSHIRKLIRQARTQKAIEYSIEVAQKHRPDLLDHLTLISSQYENYTAKQIDGTLSSNDNTINHINKSLLTLASKFEKRNISAETYEGKIVNTKPNNNYGFIETKQNVSRENIFFHFSEIIDMKTIQNGSFVKFKIGSYQGNIVAVNISLLRTQKKGKRKPSSLSKKGKPQKRKKTTPAKVKEERKSILKEKTYLPTSLSEAKSLLGFMRKRKKKKK